MFQHFHNIEIGAWLKYPYAKVAMEGAIMRKSTNAALATLQPSGIRRFSALAAQTPGCIALVLGEPEFDSPTAVREGAKTALDLGQTHYPPNNGTDELRDAISAYMSRQGVPYAPDEVVATVGATEALAATFAALLDPGDEVIILVPAFGLYESLVVLNHAVPVFLDTAPSAFQVDEEALAACVTPRTKAVVITSPNNPTGCVLSAASLDAVARVARDSGTYVICDDVYNRLVYEPGYERFAARADADLREQTVVVESFSKPWAMTGWRMGWLAAAHPVVDQISKAHQYMVSSAVSFCMPAAARALAVDPSPQLEVYRARRDRVLAQLAFMGLPVVEPAGAFYAFPSIERTGLSAEEFCERAIREAGVALVPGTFFGAPGYVRLSYCVADQQLDEGLRRLASFVASL